MFGSSAGKVKTVLKIPDMQCSMCEAHINDAIRKAFSVKKVSSSSKRKETVIWSDKPIPEGSIREVLHETGYTLTEITSIK